ncbi:MAG: 6-pyruvoyl tetrahydropterin synthase family protein [Candidatus Sigynarchaeota archaeon]
MATSIIIDASACKFSAAHFLAGHPKCSRIHGHNYHSRVRLSGELDSKGMVVDFLEAKRAIGEELDRLDHVLLLPARSLDMTITEQGDQVEISFDNKKYSIPRGDCVLLPLAAITAELLAGYLAGRIGARFPGVRVSVRVAETCTSSAETNGD